MRRALSIVSATALEILSEPLSLLVLLASLSLVVLAPAFHYHQFGEATRMARDAATSSLFLGGAALAVFGTIRAFRREIESGTLDMALAHPVSRGGFFFAKAGGCVLACLVFSLILVCASLTVVNGADIGGLVAAKSGDIARIWGPSLALGVADILLPLIVGAALNRFAHCRFVLSAFAVALVVSLAGCCYRMSLHLAGRLLPVFVLVASVSAILLAASAAFAVRLRANAAASAAGLVFLALLPFVGNYYLPDALSRGGSLPWSYVALGWAVALPAVAAFLLLGASWTGRVGR